MLLKNYRRCFYRRKHNAHNLIKGKIALSEGFMEKGRFQFREIFQIRIHKTASESSVRFRCLSRSSILDRSGSEIISTKNCLILPTYFFVVKSCHFFHLCGNIHALQNMNVFHFSLLLWVIFGLLDPYPSLTDFNQFGSMRKGY
jgi:hypothetical protein